MQNDSQARKVPASRLRLTATFCLPLDTHLSFEGSALVANSKGLHVDCPFSPGDLPGAATAQLCARLIGSNGFRQTGRQALFGSGEVYKWIREAKGQRVLPGFDHGYTRPSKTGRPSALPDSRGQDNDRSRSVRH